MNAATLYEISRQPGEAMCSLGRVAPDHPGLQDEVMHITLDGTWDVGERAKYSLTRGAANAQFICAILCGQHPNFPMMGSPGPWRMRAVHPCLNLECALALSRDALFGEEIIAFLPAAHHAIGAFVVDEVNRFFSTPEFGPSA